MNSHWIASAQKIIKTTKSYIQGGPKNVPLYFCPYLRQLFTDFQNFFNGRLCGQFAI